MAKQVLYLVQAAETIAGAVKKFATDVQKFTDGDTGQAEEAMRRLNSDSPTNKALRIAAARLLVCAAVGIDVVENNNYIHEVLRFWREPIAPTIFAITDPNGKRVELGQSVKSNGKTYSFDLKGIVVDLDEAYQGVRTSNVIGVRWMNTEFGAHLARLKFKEIQWD